MGTFSPIIHLISISVMSLKYYTTFFWKLLNRKNAKAQTRWVATGVSINTLLVDKSVNTYTRTSKKGLISLGIAQIGSEVCLYTENPNVTPITSFSRAQEEPWHDLAFPRAEVL